MTSKSLMDAESLKSIFDDASEGDAALISQQTKDLMCVSLTDNVMLGANGTDVDDIEAEMVTLVTVVLDDSGSMDARAADARAGQKFMLEAFAKSEEKDSIKIAQWFIYEPNPLHSYVDVSDAIALDTNNYRADGWDTPLYDRWMDALMANVAYAQKLRSSGTPVRSIVVVITDGGDNSSKRTTAAQCKQVAEDLIASEQFVLAFVGVKSSGYDFKKIACDMGFPDRAVKDVKDGPSVLREVFRLVSEKSLRASQTSVAPSQAANNFFNL